jgi:hypothetical protein
MTDKRKKLLTHLYHRVRIPNTNYLRVGKKETYFVKLDGWPISRIGVVMASELKIHSKVREKAGVWNIFLGEP